VVGVGALPGRAVALAGEMLGDGDAALLELVEDRGAGGPGDSAAGRASPGQHGLGEPGFRSLFGTLWVVRVPGRRPGQVCGPWVGRTGTPRLRCAPGCWVCLRPWRG
jgi:hypothetical protein